MEKKLKELEIELKRAKRMKDHLLTGQIMEMISHVRNNPAEGVKTV